MRIVFGVSALSHRRTGVGNYVRGSLAGEILAWDRPKAMFLYRTDSPLRETQLVDGLYPDTWSGRHVTYTRFRCGGGLGEPGKRAAHVVPDARPPVRERADVEDDPHPR